jgi:hypothetical protein
MNYTIFQSIGGVVWGAIEVIKYFFPTIAIEQAQYFNIVQLVGGVLLGFGVLYNDQKTKKVWKLLKHK